MGGSEVIRGDVEPYKKKYFCNYEIESHTLSKRGNVYPNLFNIIYLYFSVICTEAVTTITDIKSQNNAFN